MKRVSLVLLAAALGLGGCKACQKEAPAPIPTPSPTPKAHAEAPPPAPSAAGVETAVQSAVDHKEEWGEGLQMVLDGSGQPLLAYLEHDPGVTDDPHARQVTFIGWDADRKAFRAPQRIAGTKVNLYDHPLALARDPASGALALAFVDIDPKNQDREGITVAISRDAGLSWKRTMVGATEEGTSVRSPVLALGGGQLHLAFISAGLMVVHGALDADPATWKPAQALPLPEGYELDRNAPPSIALDAQGRPAIALGVAKDGKLAFAYGQLDGTAPHVVLDTRNQNDSFDEQLLFQGTNPRLLIAAQIEGAGDGDGWLLRSDDGGKTFGKPVRVPQDGGRHMGAPVSLAASAAGQIAATMHETGGNLEGIKCGAPLLARSSGDALTTCSPPGAMAAGDEASLPHYTAQVAFAGEKPVVAFLREQQEGPRRLEVWRER